MSHIEVFGKQDIEYFRKAGAILSSCLRHVAEAVKPGIRTIDLDAMAEKFIVSKGGKPAFKGYNGFKHTLCTSVNDECVHGIPSDRVLQEGDIVSLDCGVIVGGFYTDACVTVGVGTISEKAQHLLTVTKEALDVALHLITAGLRVGDLSATIQTFVERGGCTCIPMLTGHGLGRSLHQYPDIPNVGMHGTGPVLPAGTVIAVEPIVALGGPGVFEAGDGWTIKTKDGSLCAHFEHSILITENGCEVIA